MATTIATNQHSYSNAAAMLSATATAIRTESKKVSVTVDWTIFTAGSSLPSAVRYLVLYVGTASGEKYFSAALPVSAWNSQSTYKGSYTFEGVTIAADVTEITVGVGVSASNTSVSASGTLIWNGDAEVASSVHDPDIQFGTITGIAKCSAAYIHNGTAAKSHSAYIHNGTAFKRHSLYIRNGTTWVPYHG